MHYIKKIGSQFGVKLAGNQRAGFGASFAYLPRHSLIRCVPEQVKLATLCLKNKRKFFGNIEFRVRRSRLVLNFIKKVYIFRSVWKFLRKLGYIQLTKRCAIKGEWEDFAIQPYKKARASRNICQLTATSEARD